MFTAAWGSWVVGIARLGENLAIIFCSTHSHTCTFSFVIVEIKNSQYSIVEMKPSCPSFVFTVYLFHTKMHTPVHGPSELGL